MQPSPAQPQNPLLVMRIVCVALAAAQFLFVIVAKTTAHEPPVPMPELTQQILMVVAAGCFIASFVLPKILMKAVRMGPGVDSVAIELLAVKAVVPFILRFALLDSVGVMGLLLTLMSGNQTFVMAMVAIALVGFALSFPTESNIRRMFS